MCINFLTRKYNGYYVQRKSYFFQSSINEPDSIFFLFVSPFYFEMTLSERKKNGKPIYPLPVKNSHPTEWN